MHIRVGCEFRYEATWPTPTVMLVQPLLDGAHQVLHEKWETTPDLPMQAYSDVYGNICQRFVLPLGEDVIRYDATVAVNGMYDEIGVYAEQHSVDALPSDVLLYTLPSRVCV
jgi:hypothetical protein